jgi:hypothetical protein
MEAPIEASSTLESLPVELLALVSATVLETDICTRLALTTIAFRNAVEHISQESWKQICIKLGLLHVQDEYVLMAHGAWLPTGETWRQYFATMRGRHNTILNLVIAGNWAALRPVLTLQNVPQTYVMPASIISAAMAINNAGDRLQVLRKVLQYRCATGPAARDELGESLVQHAQLGDDNNHREIAKYLETYALFISEQHYVTAREAASNLPDGPARDRILRDFNKVPRP